MGKHKKVKSKALAGPLPQSIKLIDQIEDDKTAKSKVASKIRRREEKTLEVCIIAHNSLSLVSHARVHSDLIVFFMY